jgi:hypothetical protein
MSAQRAPLRTLWQRGVAASRAECSVDGGEDALRLGVSLAALEAFAAEHADALPPDATTADVVARVVKPALSAAGDSGSYAALLWAGRCDARGAPFTAPATAFVSHAWGNSFAELCAALAHHLEPDRDTAYVWLDVLVVDQNDPVARPHEWWSGTFCALVASMGRTLLVLSPWDDPRALGRAWCLWEVLSTLTAEDARLELLMPPSEHAACVARLEERWPAALEAMDRLDVARATAFHAHDADMIHAAVEAAMGAGDVNALLVTRLREWLLQLVRNEHEARGRAASSPLAGVLTKLLILTGQRPEAEEWLRAVTAWRDETDGQDAPTALDAAIELANFLAYDTVPKRAEAEATARRVLMMARPLVADGADARFAQVTARAGFVLAQVLIQQIGHRTDAHAEALKACAAAVVDGAAGFGPDHCFTLRVRAKLASIRGLNAQPTDVPALMAELREVAALAAAHPPGDTTALGSSYIGADVAAFALDHLGEIYAYMGDDANALLAMRQSHAFFTARRGAASQGAMLTACGMADMLLNTHFKVVDAHGNGDATAVAEADALLRHAEPASRITMGDVFPNTLLAIELLGHAAHARGDLDAAARLLQEALDGWRGRGCLIQVFSTRVKQGMLHARRGELAQARTCLHEAAAFASESELVAKLLPDLRRFIRLHGGDDSDRAVEGAERFDVDDSHAEQPGGGGSSNSEKAAAATVVVDATGVADADAAPNAAPVAV